MKQICQCVIQDNCDEPLHHNSCHSGVFEVALINLPLSQKVLLQRVCHERFLQDVDNKRRSSESYVHVGLKHWIELKWTENAAIKVKVEEV